jgi:hypothetical protein
MLICVVLGILMAFSGVEKALNRDMDNNIIIKIDNGEMDYFWFFCKLLLLPIILGGVTYLLSLNCYIFLLNLPLVMIAVRFLFVGIFASCAYDGITAYILIFALWLPLLMINFLTYVVFYMRMFEILEPTCCRSGKFKLGMLLKVKPYRYYFNYTKKACINYFVWSAIFNILYGAIILIIFSIIF